MLRKVMMAAATAAALASGPTGAFEVVRDAPSIVQSRPIVRPVSDGICGWYVFLGCSRAEGDAWARLDSLGGPGVGGWAGAQVMNTTGYPNLSPGWWCVADGPYPAKEEAQSLAWREAVPDAYVKSGC